MTDDQLAELWQSGATLTDIGLQTGVSRQRRSGGNGPASSWTPQDLLSFAPRTGCSAPLVGGVELGVPLSARPGGGGLRGDLVDIECAIAGLLIREVSVADYERLRAEARI